MKTGVITENFQSRFEYSEIFYRLKEIGFDGVDYTLSLTYARPDPIFSRPRAEWTKHFSRISSSMRENGIIPFQTHATFPTNFDGERRLTDYTLDNFRKEIEAAAILGSPYIVIHPINIALYSADKELDFQINREAFGKFEPILEEFGVTLGVENMFGWDGIRRRNCPTGCSLPEDMIKYIDAMGSERFVACLDTGHMNINAVSPAEAVRKLGSRLKLLHVHDNYGVEDNHNSPGQGVIDWLDFAAALRETGYDGALCLETSFGRALAISEETGWDYARYSYAVARKIADLAEGKS